MHFGRMRLVSVSSRSRLSLVAAVALIASLTLTMSTAQAQDATWLQTPVNGNYNDDNNWNPTQPGDTGTAFFNTSDITNITFSANSTLVGGWTFNAGADNYNFTLAAVAGPTPGL
jgi:hypothetical protein